MPHIISQVIPNVNTQVIDLAGNITYVNESMAKRLKRLRKSLGWSQQVLADQAGVSQGTIGNLESGTREYGGSVVDIARALGTTPEYLRCETDDDKAPPAPPSNFEERRPFGLSDSEWGVIQDLRDMSDNRRDEFMATIRREADDARSIAQRAIAALRKAAAKKEGT